MASRLPLFGVPGPMQRRLAAVVLVGLAPVIVFGALALRGLGAAQGNPHSGTVLVGGLVLAAFSVVAAAFLRRPVGVTLGWIVQLVTLSGALLEPMILVVGAIFCGLWITALVQGHKMDSLTAAHTRTHEAG